jgi:uncharacterized protein (DUF1697 family)
MIYIALLRGINVGRHNRMSMAGLRELFAAAGAEEVATHLQSGNVVFESRAGIAELGRRIERAIESSLGLQVSVLLRTKAQLAKVVAGNPFPAEGDAKKLHVAFLGDRPGRARVRALDPARVYPDEFQVVGREIYLHYPNGYGRSKLTNEYLERQLGVAATMRNWNTVTALAELASARRPSP